MYNTPAEFEQAKQQISQLSRAEPFRESAARPIERASNTEQMVEQALKCLAETESMARGLGVRVGEVANRLHGHIPEQANSAPGPAMTEPSALGMCLLERIGAVRSAIAALGVQINRL